MTKFKLYSIGFVNAFGNKLKNFMRNMKAKVGAVALAATFIASAPQVARAAENEISDTTNPVTQELVVDNVTESNDSIEVGGETYSAAEQAAPAAVETQSVEQATPAAVETQSVEQTAPVVADTQSVEQAASEIETLTTEPTETDASIDAEVNERMNNINENVYGSEEAPQEVTETQATENTTQETTIEIDGTKATISKNNGTTTVNSDGDLSDKLSDVVENIGEGSEIIVNDSNNVEESKDTSSKEETVDASSKEIKSNEYIVFQGEDGSYYVGLGGVGLSPNEINDLISRLQANGTIPADANVITGVLPSAPNTEYGETIGISQLEDYTFETTDGLNYVVKDKNGNIVNLNNSITDESKDLEENQKTSENPDAEPGIKAGTDEPNPEPGDKPSEPTTPDDPTPVTPKNPDTPKENKETPGTNIYKTGNDSANKAGILGTISNILGGAAITILAGLGIEKYKKLKLEREMASSKHTVDSQTVKNAQEETKKFNDIKTKYDNDPKYKDMDELERVAIAWAEYQGKAPVVADDSEKEVSQETTVMTAAETQKMDKQDNEVKAEEQSKSIDEQAKLTEERAKVANVINQVVAVKEAEVKDSEDIDKNIEDFAARVKAINESNLSDEEKNAQRNKIYDEFDAYTEEHPEKQGRKSR